MDECTCRIGAQRLPYFRTPSFSRLMFECEDWLKELSGADAASRAGILTAAGSAAMESAVINMFTADDEVLIINGGGFGQRFVDICRVHEIPFREVKLAFGEALTAAHLERAHRSSLTGLLVNIHETTTGQLYPIDLLSSFCRQHELIFLVDAISSLFADSYHMSRWGVDVTICSSHKALALPPALSFVVLSERACERVMGIQPPTLYLNLRDHLLNMERGQTPFTPAVGVVLQLHDKLKRIREVGLDTYRAGIRDNATYFRRAIADLPYAVPTYPLSVALTPVCCPRHNARHLYETAMEEDGIVLTPSGGALRDQLLRVGHLGALRPVDYDAVLKFLARQEGGVYA